MYLKDSWRSQEKVILGESSVKNLPDQNEKHVSELQVMRNAVAEKKHQGMEARSSPKGNEQPSPRISKKRSD